MEQELYDKLIKEGRTFMHHMHSDLDWQSDQELKKPQPPLTKAAMSDRITDLPKDFKGLAKDSNLTQLLIKRKSSRVYTKEDIDLSSLSYLLWATQGVKAIRGNNYATLRTVPSGGARHPFETYLIVRQCSDIPGGLYQYLPMTHQLSFIKTIENLDETIDKSVCNQTWVTKANFLFIYTFVAYRCEWRYGIDAHRPAMIDLGHIGENLYLAAAALNLGTCGIAAFDGDYLNNLIGLDGDEEFTVYAQSLGTISQDNQKAEDAFYNFLKEE